MTLNIKRITADIKDVKRAEYTSSGIYYDMNDEDISNGIAMIIGPEGSPYEDCPMLFKMFYGTEYPFVPPKVTFCTYDGHTRFHPNLYREGKVCLSILHTWEGPKWASTMRISTVLLTIQSLLDTDPLKHEPGMRADADYKGYAELIEHSCMRYIINLAEHLTEEESISSYLLGSELFIEEYKKKIPAILKRLKVRLEARFQEGEKQWSVAYGMAGSSMYDKLLDRVKILLENSLEKN